MMQMEMAFALVKAVAFSLLGCCAVGYANEVGCVTDYDSTADYFPHKATVEYAKYFNITYNNTYKIIDVNAGSYYGTQKIVAYQCGTPIPELENADIFVEIPVKYVAVSSRPMIPYIEILGERKSIKAVATNTSIVASACLNEMLGDGYTLDASSGSWGINDTILEKAGVNITFDPSMHSYNAVAFVEYLEATPQGVSEWLDFVAAFYNLEQEAAEIIDQVIDRIECLTDNAALYSQMFPGVTPKVMYSVFYPSYGYFSAGSCPNYYCNLIEAAGGTPLTNGSYLQYDEWLAVAKRADYIWHIGDFGYMYNTYSSDSDFTSLPPVVNQRVYDTSGNGKKSWYESRYMELDVVLEDLINILQNCTNQDHDRIYLRNYFTEDKGTTSTTCLDWGAALETQAGACFDLSADDLEDQCITGGTCGNDGEYCGGPGTSGSCSCDAICQSLGDCCSDYNTKCLTLNVLEGSGDIQSFVVNSGEQSCSKGFTVEETTSNCDDCTSTPIPLNFSFPYILAQGTATYEQVVIMSNGCIFLGNESSYTGSTPLGAGDHNNGTCGTVFEDTWEGYWQSSSNSSVTPAFICPYHTDINPSSSSGTYQYAMCTDMFVVKFDGLSQFEDPTCHLNLEMALYADGSIEIRYFDMCTRYYDDKEAVTLQAENGLNPITLCGPNCTCWDGYGGNYKVRISSHNSSLFCNAGPGEYCLMKNAYDFNIVMPCPEGYYCPHSAMKFGGYICEGGFYCPKGSSNMTVCLAGYYCPEGSSNMTSCTGETWPGNLVVCPTNGMSRPFNCSSQTKGGQDAWNNDLCYEPLDDVGGKVTQSCGYVPGSYNPTTGAIIYECTCNTNNIYDGTYCDNKQSLVTSFIFGGLAFCWSVLLMIPCLVCDGVWVVAGALDKRYMHPAVLKIRDHTKKQKGRENEEQEKDEEKQSQAVPPTPSNSSKAASNRCKRLLTKNTHTSQNKAAVFPDNIIAAAASVAPSGITETKNQDRQDQPPHQKKEDSPMPALGIVSAEQTSECGHDGPVNCEESMPPQTQKVDAVARGIAAIIDSAEDISEGITTESAVVGRMAVVAAAEPDNTNAPDPTSFQYIYERFIVTFYASYFKPIFEALEPWRWFKCLLVSFLVLFGSACADTAKMLANVFLIVKGLTKAFRHFDADRMDDVVEAFRFFLDCIHPHLTWLADVYSWFIGWFANFDLAVITMSSLNVTCEGSQAPSLLFANVLVVLLVVIIFETHFFPFINISIQAATNIFRTFLLKRKYPVFLVAVAINTAHLLEFIFKYIIQLLQGITSVKVFVPYHSSSAICGNVDHVFRILASTVFWVLVFVTGHVLLRTFVWGMPDGIQFERKGRYFPEWFKTICCYNETSHLKDEKFYTLPKGQKYQLNDWEQKEEVPALADILIMIYTDAKKRKMTTLKYYIVTMLWKMLMLLKMTFGIWDSELVDKMKIRGMAEMYDDDDEDESHYHQDMICLIGQSHCMVWQFAPSLVSVSKFMEASHCAPIYTTKGLNVDPLLSDSNLGWWSGKSIESKLKNIFAKVRSFIKGRFFIWSMSMMKFLLVLLLALAPSGTWIAVSISLSFPDYISRTVEKLAELGFFF